MNPQAAGPGSVETTLIAPSPLLEGATDSELITILNPLTVDFVGLIGLDKPIDTPFQIRKTVGAEGVSQTESDVRSNYGLTLKNKDHTSRMSITNKVVIPSGKTYNLQGSAAKVVVFQLVNEIMQREGNHLKLADPNARHEVEQRVIISRGRIADLLGNDPLSVQQQINQAVNKANETNDEEEFPDTGPENSSSGSSDSRTETEAHPKRAVGRPAKSAKEQTASND